MNISEKVLQDLEFTTVLEQVAEHSISNLGKKEILSIQPIAKKKQLMDELYRVNEYLSSFENENRIPNHGFEDLYVDVKRLAIDNSYLEPPSFIKIATMTETVGVQKKFLKKFKT